MAGLKTEIRFIGGISASGSSEHATLVQLRPGADAVMLRRGEDLFLLGDVAAVAPDVLDGIARRVQALLARVAACQCAEKKELAFFCGMSIPDDDPRGVGFDLSRIIAVNMETGEALEASLPEMPLVSLRSIISRLQHQG